MDNFDLGINFVGGLDLEMDPDGLNNGFDGGILKIRQWVMYMVLVVCVDDLLKNMSVCFDCI